MVNIIPLAGLGSRFSENGYLLPKPLVPVSGEPMIVQVIRGMPRADKWIFVVRKEHVRDFAIDQVIRSEIKDAVIVEIDKTTEGQASTCMLAMAHVKDDEEVFIAPCDSSALYNKKDFELLRRDNDVDAVIWSVTQSSLLTDNPKAFGWLKVGSDGKTIDGVSVKIPVSEDPFNDHAVTANFYFKKAADFKAAYDLMYRENYRVNNEFYVDSMPIFMKKLGKRSVIFDVDLYVSWGKPVDLYIYQLKEQQYRSKRLGDDPTDALWEKFFDLMKR